MYDKTAGACAHSLRQIRGHHQPRLRTRGGPVTTTHPHSRSPGDALTPHARGLHPWPARRHQVHGIIPAHAGFTPSTTGAATGWSDHPRTRGVYGDALGHQPRTSGSSPHTRGLLVGGSRLADEDGIIPACAGFTCRRTSCVRGTPDHPRMRGVYSFLARWWSTASGSSPHARGLPCKRS